MLGLVVASGTFADRPDQDCPAAHFAYTLSGEADFVAGTTLETKETRFAACAARIGARFRVGADYQYTRYVYDGLDSRNRDLHRLQVPVSWTGQLRNWQAQAIIAPGFATSSNVLKEPVDRFSADDFFTTAHVEFQRGDTGPLVGVAWDRAFGEPRIYPLAGWRFAPSSGIAVRLAFPDSAVRIDTDKRQSWLLRLYPAGFEWHVLDDDLVTEFDYSVEAWRAEAWWRLRATGKLRIDLGLAWEFDRHHEFTDRGGVRIDGDVDDVLLLTFGLSWRDGPPPASNRVAAPLF